MSRPFSLFTRAWLLAMLDRFDEAVPLARESSERLRELDGRRIGEIRLAEIARMAAQGMSNKELAQTLFVTVKAVEVHLSSVYRKLRISSRAQLAQALAGTGNPAFSRRNMKATGQSLGP